MDTNASSILGPLLANAEKHPDKLLYAFLDQEGRMRESFTYEAFLQRAGDIAQHIRRVCPLDPGERVLLVHPPGLEMICSFFACVRLGLIPVPVYPPSSRGFEAALYKLEFIARDCQAAAVLTERSYFWSMKLHRTRKRIVGLSFRRDFSSRLPWIVTDDAEQGTGIDMTAAGSDILFLQYTSGSTRDPKGVIVTHRNLLQNCAIVMNRPPMGVSWLPQYHDMGLIGCYLFPALAGGTTHGFSPIDFLQRPLLWLRTMSRVRATMSAAPNFAYAYCLRPDKISDDDLRELDLSSLEVLMNGAEPVQPHVFHGFLERFEPCGLRPDSFVAAYGLAEFTLAVSIGGRSVRTFDARGIAAGEVRLASKAGQAHETTSLVSSGRPLRTTEVRIVDVAGLAGEAHPGRIGEIWVKGPSKCRGYWNRPELSRRSFEARLERNGPGGGEWLRTGDLGFMLDGELFVCGRIKDLVILRGRNYFPQDIEALVEEDPAVRPGCVAAFGVPGKEGERLVIVAEIRNPKRLPDTASIHRAIQNRIGIAAHCLVYVPARSIPKTSSGKLVRHETRARWEANGFPVIARIETGPPHPESSEGSRGAGPSSNGAQADPARALLDRLARRYGLTGTENVTLADAGLDSLSMAELALDLETCLKHLGADDLAGAIDLRWLPKIAVSELFALVRDFGTAAPRAKLRFRKAFSTLEREHREVEASMMRADARLGFHPSTLPRPAAVREATGGGVLLTGGTGFFGPFLLQSLLELRDDDIYVLVRGESAERAGERLGEGLASLGLPPGSRALVDWERRVIPVLGDLAKPQLGVSSERWRFLSERVHSIYHNGARVNYLDDYGSLRDANVGGTAGIVRFALTGLPKVVNHVSTTFVFGWSTKDTLYESDRNREMDLLDFGYSQTKWVSEQVVFDAMRSGLSARVFRPALITPSVNGGGYNFDIAIRLLAFMIKHAMNTTARNQVSFSPADVVARNIVGISLLPDTVGRTFHVTRDDYANMCDITDILGRLLGIEFTDYSLERFVPRVIERCGPEDLLFPLLNFLVRSVDNITAMEFKRYCNRNYREARDRSPVGVADPHLEDVVLGIMRFMRRHGLIDAGSAIELPQGPVQEKHHVL